MKIKPLAAVIICTALVLASGCGSKTSESSETIVTIARNDWYGALQRISTLRKDAQAVVSILDEQNYDVVMGNPTDYWSDDYFFLNFNPVDSDYLGYTIYLNESDDWATVTSNVTTAVGSCDKITVVKNDINDYSISYDGYVNNPDTGYSYYTTTDIDCIYDASHDWAQMIETTDVYGTSDWYEDGLYEFAEISAGRYCVQTETDRLYCEYDAEGNLELMCYSILGSEERQPVVTETGDDTVYSGDSEINVSDVVTEEADEEESEETYGNRPSHYNSQDDSIFKNLDRIGPDWVTEEPTVNQYIIYKDNTLTFQVKNKLSGEYEGFEITRKYTDETTSN